MNDTRSLARQALTFSGYPASSQEVTTFIHYLIAFTYALKHQLRDTDALPDLQLRLPAALASAIHTARYKPVMLIREMAAWIQKAKEEGKIDSVLQVALDDRLNKLTEIVGGCERIKSTPIPYTYRVLLHRTVYLYCFLLPFGFVESLGWFTPVFVVFIAYTFVALEAIADEIEEPFGLEPNDLAINALCVMIATTLLEMAGKPLPEQPADQSCIVQ